jgi:hypothetical protein
MMLSKPCHESQHLDQGTWGIPFPGHPISFDHVQDHDPVISLVSQEDQPFLRMRARQIERREREDERGRNH